ncbi:MAG: zinc ribbon domain-containing protein [Candidatus Latescibacteria bacterium]|nr:zinc ribbon domain-containing protein [Candidatus Latescibacterota bacterium]
MPIYEYKCERCGHRFERFQSLEDKEVKTCEKCGGPVRRVISRSAFVLKGSGWYVTDYPSKSRKKGMEAEKKAEGEQTKAEKEKPKES